MTTNNISKRLLTLVMAISMIATLFAGITFASAEGTLLEGFYDIATVNNVSITPYIGETIATATTKDVDGDGNADTWYESSNRLAVSYTAAKTGAYYGVILVNGTEVPTKDNTIFYIDQITATSNTVTFDVYPLLPVETTVLTLYITSNAEEFDLVPVLMNYVCQEETVAPPPAAGVKVSGTVTSYLNTTDNVTVELVSGGATAYTFTGAPTGTAAAKTTAYTIENVAAGTYTIKVSKNNHVTLEEEVVVGTTDVAKDAKICPKGDVNNNGGITTIDFTQANSHARKMSTLTGYKLKCADVVGNTQVTTADAMRINAHARKTSYLW